MKKRFEIDASEMTQVKKCKKIPNLLLYVACHGCGTTEYKQTVHHICAKCLYQFIIVN